MKIVIMAGGTGSIALQTGLYKIIENTEGIDIKILVNAYDSGLSTGQVRQVLGGNILGPSDVRKNQTTRHTLQYGETPLSRFLNIRFTIESSKAEDFCINEIVKLNSEYQNILLMAVKAFFSSPVANKIDYNDFSLANIVYAGLAAKNNNSLRAAATIMAQVLAIEDNVILNDDTSLFLGAITASGERIADEADIVSWNNPEDPIVDVFFTNVHGEEAVPVLCDEARAAIIEADYIILSSGTQWSSLIPTYASVGFQSTIANSDARVMMVMNKVPDKDAPSQGADDIINQLVPTYFPYNRIELILSEESSPLMNKVSLETSSILKSAKSFNMSQAFETASRHNPYMLAKAIAKTIFGEYLDAAAFMFDYDDTLVGRGNTFKKESAANIEAIIQLNQKTNVAICSGNSIRAIKVSSQSKLAHKFLTVYTDGGINEYQYDTTPNRYSDADESRAYTFVRCLSPEAQLTNGTTSAQNIISALCASGIPAAKIENRRGVMLSIKPIDPEYRQVVHSLVQHIVGPSGLEVRTAGRTTIEISSPFVNKRAAVQDVRSKIGPRDFIVFVGDEFDSGNDAPVLDMSKTDAGIKCLKVKSPADTLLFFSALKSQEE